MADVPFGEPADGHPARGVASLDPFRGLVGRLAVGKVHFGFPHFSQMTYFDQFRWPQ